ncbi:hypothetical protein [Actomonas aquatica]|uniref:Lipoprotein n=1 Tax=Actomonas aquatica TaxID=2866162 RepID=A0ABZ1C3B2_9BACT|nr:hypothetical protein [Opitutus sp. WL0086]WRQ85832.1 hypothetical protein K1X11_013550 [Opitutus sp. WL0086]
MAKYIVLLVAFACGCFAQNYPISPINFEIGRVGDAGIHVQALVFSQGGQTRVSSVLLVKGPFPENVSLSLERHWLREEDGSWRVATNINIDGLSVVAGQPQVFYYDSAMKELLALGELGGDFEDY